MALEAAFEALRTTTAVDNISINLIPADITPQDVISLIGEHGSTDQYHVLKTIYTALEVRPNPLKDDSWRNDTNGAVSRLSELLLPKLNINEQTDETKYDEILQSAQCGIELLHLLVTQDEMRLPPSASLALATYTRSDDQWSNQEIAESAQEVLQCKFEKDISKLQNFILEDVLNAFIRPLFSKSRPSTVTASGRKAEFVQPSRYDNFDAGAEANKPWKYQNRYAITVFMWAVDHVEEETLRKNWHQFTPVLLTLLDETDTALKIQAIDIFKAFWSRCPSGIMQQTGLAQVFENAIFPAVLYLPNLTPEDESVRILSATYSALFAMAGINPDPTTSKPQSDVKLDAQQRKLADKIVRGGILEAFQHSGQYIKIVEILCRNLKCIVNGMGIFAVKHLKEVIPMLSSIISDPFASAHPPSLCASLDALTAVQSTCWPRIPGYTNNIINMLMLCWLSLEDDGVDMTMRPNNTTNKTIESGKEEQNAHIVEKLKHNARMLDAILQARNSDLADEQGVDKSDILASELKTDKKDIDEGKSLTERVRPLVEKHAVLAELFGTN